MTRQLQIKRKTKKKYSALSKAYVRINIFVSMCACLHGLCFYACFVFVLWFVILGFMFVFSWRFVLLFYLVCFVLVVCYAFLCFFYYYYLVICFAFYFVFVCFV